VRGSTRVLVTLGFAEAYERATVVTLDGYPLRVPTLASLLVLKLVAWNDRRAPKDLSDVARIIRVLEPTGEDPFGDGALLEHMAAGTLHLDDVTLWFTGRDLVRTLRPATQDAVRAIVMELRGAPFATRAPMRQLAPVEDDLDERDAWVLHQLEVLWLALAPS
jgi:predicted nucleotidyltransferase